VTGLGCNNFGGRLDVQATRAVVDAAIEAGITLFDTADIYGGHGGSESALGEVLGKRRDQVVLATKFGHQRADMGSSGRAKTDPAHPERSTGSAGPLPGGTGFRHPQHHGSSAETRPFDAASRLPGSRRAAAGAPAMCIITCATFSGRPPGKLSSAIAMTEFWSKVPSSPLMSSDTQARAFARAVRYPVRARADAIALTARSARCRTRSREIPR
jgi:hypothetical protein